MDEMIAEQKNISMFFHCWGVDVIQDGDKVLGVVFESKEGRQAILAKQVVDCTGDASVVARAGFARERATVRLPGTFVYTLDPGVDVDRLDRAALERAFTEALRWQH